MASKNIRNYFPELTGMRAVAAYFVYLHHFNPLKSNILGAFPRMFIDELHIGVSVFFVLSGFLISYRYMDSFEYSGNGLFTYFKRRFTRIYPMYFIVTVITFFCLFVQHPVQYFSWKKLGLLFANLTLIRGFFANMVYSLVGQGWSLTVEECFYLIAPLIFFYRKRIKIYVYPILIICAGCLLVMLGKIVTVLGFFESYQFMFLLTFFGRCTEFIIGMYLAGVVKKMLNKNIGNNNNTKYYFTLAGILGIIICLCSYVYFKANYSNYSVGVFKTMNINDGVLFPTGLFINNIIQPVFIAILFYGLITENTFLKKTLSSDLFILLGKASYVFYLIHTGVIRTFCEFLVQRISYGNSKFYHISEYFFMFLLMNLLSILIYKLVEQKLHKYLNGISFKSNKKIPAIVSED
jgi:peptidoglycan/LPS O-acetylase OafA/YrhL